MNFIVGFLAALCGGMGLGGGGILILYLAAIGTEQLSAQGINLLFFLPTAAIAIFFHGKNGFIRWDIGVKTAFFGIPGVLIGSFIAQSIEEWLLKALFGGLMLTVGVRELMQKKRDGGKGTVSPEGDK